MSDDDSVEFTPSYWSQHKFLVLIGGAIICSLVMVSVALGLYASSGAAQLDLSRPGYQAVRSQTDKADKYESFSSTGSINQTALDDFKKLYDKQSKDALSVDAFGGTPLDDSSLGLDSPAIDQVE